MSAPAPARSREALETRIATLWRLRTHNTYQIAQAVDVHEAWVEMVVAGIVEDERRAGLR